MANDLLGRKITFFITKARFLLLSFWLPKYTGREHPTLVRCGQGYISFYLTMILYNNHYSPEHLQIWFTDNLRNSFLHNEMPQLKWTLRGIAREITRMKFCLGWMTEIKFGISKFSNPGDEEAPSRQDHWRCLLCRDKTIQISWGDVWCWELSCGGGFLSSRGAVFNIVDKDATFLSHQRCITLMVLSTVLCISTAKPKFKFKYQLIRYLCRHRTGEFVN